MLPTSQATEADLAEATALARKKYQGALPDPEVKQDACDVPKKWTRLGRVRNFIVAAVVVGSLVMQLFLIPMEILEFKVPGDDETTQQAITYCQQVDNGDIDPANWKSTSLFLLIPSMPDEPSPRGADDPLTGYKTAIASTSGVYQSSQTIWNQLPFRS